MNIKNYYYRLLGLYHSLYVRSDDVVVEVNPYNDLLSRNLLSRKYFQINLKDGPFADQDAKILGRADYIIINGYLHYEKDIQAFLSEINRFCRKDARIIIGYYSKVWQPLINLATTLGLRSRTAEMNWLSHSDIHNFAALSGFKPIQRYSRILLPIYIPLISALLNRWVAPLPFFNQLSLVNMAVIATETRRFSGRPSVSVVVPARNEEGNIDKIVETFPKMGENDELIFVEGNSTDNTWKKILEVAERERDRIKIVGLQQEGKGKGDAVRKGFSVASGDILMIWDADMTVQGKDLPKFYDAIINDRGEFINGSRLVYPMEDGAMRFFNIIGNKFFAEAFSFVLKQEIKDTLCGTKVLSKENYLRIQKNRSYFGEFDPFGDFDLLFGAARMGLKIIEVPITYKARTYGETNISRWKHGWLLLRMVAFGSRKLKFV